MLLPSPLLSRLDARDRALFLRWAVAGSATRRIRLLWVVITHIGGATCSIFAAIAPRLFGATGELARSATQALQTLVISHLVVQLVKRTVGRPRPSRAVLIATSVREPDQFSFPSGHSAAAMSVAFMYALAFPTLAAPLLAIAFVVGMSRVCLGVHYPGDVLVGQAIAVLTGVVVRTLS
jgi:undecaprenyl-diphosphatase